MTSAEHVDGPVDLVLSPATRLLWRAPDSVHLEIAGRGVVVDGLPPRLVRRLAGAGRGVASDPVDDTPDTPGTHDAPDAATTAVLTGLRDAGYLWPRQVPGSPGVPSDDPYGAAVDERRVPPTPRLAGELLSLTARHGEQAAELLAARRHVSVAVHGSGRIVAHLAALLAAAGVGRVHCVSSGVVRLRDVVPGGLDLSDEGHDFAAAADAAIRRAAPETETGPLPPDEHPDLTVLAVDAPVDEIRRAALHAAGAAHLVVSLGIDHGVVGPLVVPGLTSCLRCADLHRRDRDPLWPALAAQLTVAPRYGNTGDVAVASLVVATAAVQILAFLDGGDPACLDGSLELRLPDWRLRRRSRVVHVDCDCARDR